MKEPLLLAELRARDIQIWANGAELQLDTPTGALTPELSEQLRQHKSEILEFLLGPAELSFAQQRLWFLDRVNLGGSAYVIASGIEIRGALGISALEISLGMLVNRHDLLRTVFVEVEGRPLQVVSESGAWTMSVVDMSDEANAYQRLPQLLREEAARGFDLARGALFRAVLYRLRPNEHVLLLLQHHIISDAWSVDVVWRELGVLYRDSMNGRMSTLPELTMQYREFARREREWLQGEVLARLLEYWRSQLTGAPQVLDLPTDRPRPPDESHRGAIYSFAISRETTEELALLSRSERATLFMGLMAAFDVLLWRYTGQEDLLVGIPVANREQTDVEGLIGPFVNTLVLRSNLSGNDTAKEILARVRERCLDAYAHQGLPVERLVENLRAERDLSRNPLFQVMLVLQNAPQHPFVAPGLTVTPLEVDRGAAHVDLTLYVQETPQGLKGTFEYATDLFDTTTIERMAGHWRTLIEAMIATPERRLSDLPLLTAAERQQLQVDLNKTDRDYPRQALMQELFEAQARHTPERTALSFGAASLSYAELDRRANRIAQALRSRGVGRGQRVGLCIERGTDMLAAVLGILKAGAAYVPLDPMFPQERLRFMAEDAQLALLVSSSALAGTLGLPRERQLLLDADAKNIDAAPDTRLPADAHSAKPGDPAYVIYTSGSTGKPKGVIVSHRAVVNFLTSMSREPGLTADDVLVAVTTLSFDIAVLELQLPLTLGATVVIASRDEAIDGHALKTLLEQTRATVMQATPVTWRLLLEAGWKAGKDFKALVGGEGLPKDLADQLIASGVELWNMYGPTETTVWSTCARITDTSNGITIGKPIANTTVYILDAQKNLCPIGVPGELCIGGDGITLGYWNRPELTAERFIPDPYSTTPGTTLYRTGDRARWRNDGTLEHLGRLDFQVKIRGYRIELGEIETSIARHPAIREVVVIAREDVPGDTRLVAYLVTENPPADLAGQLRALLRTTLPEYMIPAHFVPLDALPRTPNAKVDRKALPSPNGVANAIDSHGFMAPRNDLEISLTTAWEKVLRLNRVGISDNFFELGGNSLSVLKLIFEMEQATGIEIALADIFSFPTIAGLVTQIGTEAKREASVVVPLQPEGDASPIYCICGINIYRAFAQSVGKEQPVYGVYVEEEQVIIHEIAEGGKPVISIERLVEAYAKAIARVRPHGPYRLAGVSFGGVLAMALASNLRARGEQVDLVFLFDAILPNGMRRNWAKWIYRNVGELMTDRGRTKLYGLYTRFRNRFVRRSSEGNTHKRAVYIDDAFAARQGNAFLRASSQWKTRKSITDFPVILFRAIDKSDWGQEIEFDEDYGWRRYAGDRLSIVSVSGDHLGIIELPHVANLAREARRFLGHCTAQ